MAPSAARTYPSFTKMRVGLTVNMVCSRSPETSATGKADSLRAILVISGSDAGVPQPEQKRTPGATYEPQLEQCI